MVGYVWLERLSQDLRYGCRMLAKNPGFTLVAVLSLAIGIGANTAVFSFADTLLLRPLPVPRPGEVLTVGLTDRLSGLPARVVSRLRRHPGSQQELRRIGRVHQTHRRLCHRCRRHAETDDRHAGERQLLPGHRRGARAGTRLPARRRPGARTRRGRHARPRFLGAAVRRGSLHPRPHGAAQRDRLHRHRRGARRVHGPGSIRPVRVLRAADDVAAPRPRSQCPTLRSARFPEPQPSRDASNPA